MASNSQSFGFGSSQDDVFQPKSEWKEEEGANILQVYLPGFEKEQIKVTYVHATRTISVQGEQRLGFGRLRRFNEAFSVPRNCKVFEIGGKFQNETLIITMPKEIVTQVGPKEAAKIMSPKAKEETAPQATSPTATTTDTQKPKEETRLPSQQSRQKAETLPKPKAQIGQEVTSPKATSGIPKKIDALFDPQRPTNDKAQDKTTLPKVTSPASIFNQQVDKKSTSRKAKTVEDQKSMEKPIYEEKNKPVESGKPKSYTEKESEKGSTTKTNAPAKIVDGEKAKIDKDAGPGKQKQEEEIVDEKKLKEAKTGVAAAAMKAVQEFALEVNEEKKAMVNMGVAVLVLAAFGAYIAYSFGSSGKVKD